MVVVVALVWMTVFVGLLANPMRFREAALAAFTLIGVALLVITEGLSLFSAISPVAVALSWLSILLASCVLLWRHLPAGYDRLRGRVRVRPGRADAAFLSVVGLFAAGSLARAVLYPPSNWDSLTYHLPRVFFWLQNGSVAHYPTAEARQLFSSPFANYAVLHVQAMTGGGDRFVGLPHVSAYIFMLVAVSLIALRLGATTRGQWFATLTAATVPMAVLQAPTTQNDLMCAAWCLIAVYGVLGLVSSFSNENDTSVSTTAWTTWAAGAAALAYLTKPTAVLLLAPFAVWLLLGPIRSTKPLRFLKITGLALATVLLLSGPWFARNATALDGDFLGLSAPGNTHLLTAARSPGGLTTNALMNASMLFALPVQEANAPLERLIEDTAHLLGVAELESVMGEPNYGPYETRHWVWNHDVAPAPVTVWLLLASGLTIAFSGNKSRLTLTYIAASSVGLLLILTALGWQPWVSRLMLPGILTLTPIVGVAMDCSVDGFRRPLKATLTALVVLSLVLGVFVMLFDAHHRLVPLPRSFWNTSYDDLRYRAAPDLAPALRPVAEYVGASGVERVGLNQLAGDFPTYLLLASVRDAQVVYVGNIVLSKRFTERKEPEMVVALMREDQYTGFMAATAADGHRDLLQPQSSMGWIVLVRTTEEAPDQRE
ncbi:MAG: hypothetical protein U1E26_06055 [Coriobacteriia bacterium]|nr:hypothetical protein [Coriobacteriia bacterium]